MNINLNNGELQVFFEIFSSCFNIKSREAFLEKQTFFSDCFPIGQLERYQTPYLNKETIEPLSDNKLFLEKYYNQSYWTGLDYPVFVRENHNSQNMMIIAEDPLRNRKDPYLIPHKDKLLLSTPFATHLKSCRDKYLKEYWDINSFLLSNGYNVYLTDVYKLWMMKDDLTIKEKLPEDFIYHLKTCLKKEVDFIKPRAIITYGKRALNALLSMEIEFDKEKIISFPHPSRTANGTWKKILSKHFANHEITCGSENKYRYVEEQLRKHEWFGK